MSKLNISECDGCEPPFSDACASCSELSKDTKLSQYDKQELKERAVNRYFKFLDVTFGDDD